MTRAWFKKICKPRPWLDAIITGVVVGIVVILVDLLFPPACAAEYNGHDLRAQCLDPQGICHGYIVAVADATVANDIACPPQDVATTQLVEVVWEFLESLKALEPPVDSAWLDFPAYSLASHALREHWPCAASEPQTAMTPDQRVPQ